MELFLWECGRPRWTNSCEWLHLSPWYGRGQVGPPRHPQFGMLLQETPE